MQRAIAALAIFFLYACAWFCLWAIGAALVAQQTEAVMLFPFGLRIGILLLAPRRHWSGILLAEAMMLWFLSQQFGAGRWLWAAALNLGLCVGLASLAGGWLRRYRQEDAEWQRPLQQGAVVVLAALLQTAGWSLVARGDAGQALLLGLSGGLTVAPTCLLIWHYLARQIWLPLEPGLIHHPVNLRLRHLVCYLALFTLSLWLQHLAVNEELRRFVPFCLAIPVVFMSWRYGWQGALLATLLNGIVLVATDPHDAAAHRDMLLSLLAQSLMGMLLGAGIERQRYLNQQLSQKLAENRELARLLVMAEENTRREIARELHDEIGQTITVIRTQSSIIRRLTREPKVVDSAGAIERYALRIYDGVHDLLARLWPAALTNLPLSAAIAALLRELVPPEQPMVTVLNWRIPDQRVDDSLKVLLYRLCQEGVTNACRHAGATRIEISAQLSVSGQLHVSIRDDGRGVDAQRATAGYGLRGISDRVRAMGGEFRLLNRQGTELVVILPTIFARNG
ncbi:signal transduction histidine-protein kinase/phosphatase UhpB [Affinibrenneria salicis]|uniref:Signal transduction histidine-protein kinase/phosphatase UhpB n=1 Tax=Affinibrenneria salicis TaxID=2590031 RepID=A0A5J5G1M1_9GAMM|nr:signal transduction histidine-protein kinase/phosphatase UhpB [Affinibrenneria salicis]KAA9000575.1 signal transduction histidine-protein kinase/phosphatase UhpB [Affinibrenneria salicis]